MLRNQKSKVAAEGGDRTATSKLSTPDPEEDTVVLDTGREQILLRGQVGGDSDILVSGNNNKMTL